ncbi:hypothetical protein CUJ83_13450 [Methanocella sp. CWC-04]|uniref:Uncharacterized protein n=2 Tax=Methanooceanicella nereidis TaxID=2052831 RepID=A0AAP2RET2_9EURY|nr:hypothetical protein [Methanocella sp. CWC-04]
MTGSFMAVFIDPVYPHNNNVHLISYVAGMAMIIGTFSLCSAINKTFLRSGGRMSFKIMHISFLSCCSTGFALILSVHLSLNFYPVFIISLLLLLISGLSTLSFHSKAGD